LACSSILSGAECSSEWVLRLASAATFITASGGSQKDRTNQRFSKQNAFFERFNLTYRTEILDFYLFRTLNEAREITERWLNEYNSERPHESLNNLTPEEYRMMAEKTENSKIAWE
jgi:putative transposase